MTLRCWAARWPTSLDEMSSRVSTPARARSSVFGLGVVGLAHGDAEVGRPGWAARQGDDFGGRHLGLELVDDEAAELPGGSGDGDGHEVSFPCGWW